jgi:hypothetical protein
MEAAPSEPTPASPATEAAPQPAAAPRPARIIRPAIAARAAPQPSFPTWRPLPEPRASRAAAPSVPAAAAAAVTLDELPAFIPPSLPVPRATPRRAPLDQLALLLRMAVALPATGPISYLAGWVGLPGSGPDFLMTGLGRVAWAALGGPNGMVVYWVLLFVGSCLAATPKLLQPLIWLSIGYWGLWLGHLAGDAGLLPMPLPWLPDPP